MVVNRIDAAREPAGGGDARILKALFSLAVVLLLLAGAAAAAGPPLEMGVSLSLSGPFQTMGRMQQRGFLLWQEHVNQKGGLLGRPLKLRVVDDASSPRKARSIYQDFITRLRLPWLLGPYSSPITEAVLPVTEHHGYPLLITGAASDLLWRQGYRNAFGVLTPASRYPVGFLQLVVKRGLDRLAIVAADDSFSQALAQSVLDWARRLHLTVVCQATVERGCPSMQGLAGRVRETQAQVLVICGHLQESVCVLRALDAVGWRPQACYAAVGPATERFRQMLGAGAEGVFSSSLWEAEIGVHYPRGRRFGEDFQARFGMAPSYHAAAAYAGGMIMESALAQAKSWERQGLGRVLSHLDTMTVMGRYGVDKTGKQIRHFPLIIQWQGGKKMIVWPEGLSNAPARFAPQALGTAQGSSRQSR